MKRTVKRIYKGEASECSKLAGKLKALGIEYHCKRLAEDYYEVRWIETYEERR